MLATLHRANKTPYQTTYHLNRWPLATTRPFQCPSLETTSVFRFQPHEMRNENDARSFTQYGSDAFQPALRSKNPYWQALPLARRPGKKALPDARGGGWIGGSAWQQECAQARALYARSHGPAPATWGTDARITQADHEDRLRNLSAFPPGGVNFHVHQLVLREPVTKPLAAIAMMTFLCFVVAGALGCVRDRYEIRDSKWPHCLRGDLWRRPDHAPLRFIMRGVAAVHFCLRGFRNRTPA